MLRIFFAVPHEARPFLQRLRATGSLVERLKGAADLGAEMAWQIPGGEVWVTGMGAQNSRRVAEALLSDPADRVLTCGFAGGLDPALPHAQIVHDVDPTWTTLVQRLTAEGSRAATFSCQTRVAITRQEKSALRAGEGADVVEMESGVIREICRRKGIQSATVRVISDTADQDLPLDFNALMTPSMQLDFARLALRLLQRPGCIPELLKFQGRVGKAATALAEILVRLLPTLK